MYCVVRNKAKCYYPICTKWLVKVDESPNDFTCYPPTEIMEKCLRKKEDINDDWSYEEIEVMCSNIDGT